MDLSIFELEMLYRAALQMKIEGQKEMQLACIFPDMKASTRRRIIQSQDEAYKLAASGKTYQETQEDLWRQIHEQAE